LKEVKPMARKGISALDAQKILFQGVDISKTVRRIETKYSSSGRGRPRYHVRAMLMALMLMYALDAHGDHARRSAGQASGARELCGFSECRTPDRTTFSKFITRATPETIEGTFRELRRQALEMGLYGRGKVGAAMDAPSSTPTLGAR
jgi:hypothetical protein